MQAFKSYLKILNHNKGGIIIYVIIFMVITVLFSSIGKDSTATGFAMTQLDVAVIDRDNTDASKGLTNYIGSIHNIVDIDDTKESMQDNLFYRNVNYILIIPEGYGEQLSQGNIDEIINNVKVPNSFEGIFVDRQVDQYLKTMVSYVKSGYDTKEALSLTTDNLKVETTVSMLEENTSSEDSGTDPIFFYYQYMAYVLLCITIVGLGPILMVFNKPDLKKRIDVSALNLKTKNRQLITFSIVFSIALWSIFVILSGILFGKSIFTTTGLFCMCNSLIFSFICLAITYLITMIFKSLNSISSVSNVLGLGMSFLCGVFVPQEVMAPSVLNASRILPAYWYIHAHNTIVKYIGSSSQIRTILADFGIQLGFAVALLAICLMVSKMKRDNA